MGLRGFEVREARIDDHDDVAAFTRGTWSDREADDYLPDVYPDWIEGDPGPTETLVVDAGDEVVGIAQCVFLSPFEAWCQGLRIDPDYRGRGLSTTLTHRLFDWAREQGAVVARNMVFSWNTAGLGQSRAVGFEPATEFRWATPEPDGDAEPDLPVTADPDAAWHAWTDSDARSRLRGLALDLDESWAVSRLTRENLHRAADDTAVVAVQDEGVRGLAYRVRDYERDGDDGPERRAEYGVGAWADDGAARALFAAIARDAARIGADRTRVLVPETARHVSDAAHVRAGISDEPYFVFAADLTADYRR